MLFTITPGHLSPKVLMISAVCGRAPPAIELPYEPPVPPPCPATDHDWLSVTKIRAFSGPEAAFWFSCATAEFNHERKQRQASKTNNELFKATLRSQRVCKMSGERFGPRNMPLSS